MEWPSTRVRRAKQLNSTTAASTQPITSWSHSYNPAPGRRGFLASPVSSVSPAGSAEAPEAAPSGASSGRGWPWGRSLYSSITGSS